MNDTEKPQRWHRTKSAAEHIGTSSSTLAIWRMYGTGPAYSKVGRVIVYDEADLNTWVASRRVRTKELPSKTLSELRKQGKGTRETLSAPKPGLIEC